MTGVALAVVAALGTMHGAQAADWRDKTPVGVRDRADAGESVDVLIRVRGDAALRMLDREQSFVSKVTEATTRLRSVAEVTQGPVLAHLRALGVEGRPFWIVNAIAARLTPAQLAAIAGREDVEMIESDRAFKVNLPVDELGPVPNAILAVEPNVTRVRAPSVWALGYYGQGIVIGAEDTGYQWDHPAVKSKYRGWDGVTATHAYNWHDAIHVDIDGASNPCGMNTTAPCDDNSHGTHTIGTVLGDDGSTNQIGVAPAAKWMGCRNMDSGTGRPSTYIECFEFFMAPTDVAGGNPDPSKAPHIITNSWGCPVGPPPNGEDCALNSFDTVTTNLRNAGILVVVAAGNGSAFCGGVADPPAILSSVFTIGSTTNADAISSFSNWGPVTVDGSNRLKPDVSAPGSSVRSAVPTNGYGTKSGTSMATPNAAGVAALIMSADPSLIGQPAQVEQIMRSTAIPLTSASSCSGFPGSTVPNTIFGHGRIDALNAVQSRIAGNTPPTITGPGAQTMSEDGVAGPMSITVGDTQTAADALTVTATSNNPALVPNTAGALALGGTGTARTITVTPVANTSGSVIVTLTVRDGANAIANSTMNLTVNAVNDAPSFTVGSDSSHVAGVTGVQTRAGFVTSVNFGPNESSQAVSAYTVTETSDLNNIVSAAAIATNGTLTYTLSGAAGTATLEATLRDNGGTANGGVDTSAPVSFNIVVQGENYFADQFE